MKRLTLLILLLFVVFLFSACNPEPAAIKPEEPASPVPADTTVISGQMTEDLTKLNENEEKFFRFENGSQSTLNLEGATINSLYVIEKQSNSRSIGNARGLSDLLSQYSDSPDTFVILPQVDGKLSLSGLDLGIETEGLFKIKRLGSNATLKTNASGDKYFQYKIDNTEFNYRTKGYPEYMYPTYLNYFVINLNDPEWARYKDQKIVISQSKVSYDHSKGGGSETSEHFGLVDIGSIVYGSDQTIQGLYDLKGKDWLFIYSFLRTNFVDCVDLRDDLYFLLPEEYEEGSGPVKIESFPHAFVIKDDFSPEKAYIISLRDVPEFEPRLGRNLFDDVVNVIANGGRFKAGEHNGEYSDKTAYIQNIAYHNGKFDADLYLTGMDEDILLKLSSMNAVDCLDYGTFSFTETDDTTWIDRNCIDLDDPTEHIVQITNEESCVIVWDLPDDSTASYRFTANAYPVTTYSQRWSPNGGGGGSGGNTLKEDFIISAEENTHGFMTITTQKTDAPVTVTWRVEKIEGPEGKQLTGITIEGTPSIQRAFTSVNPAGLTVTAHYSDNSSADVTAEAVFTTENGLSDWPTCIHFTNGWWRYHEGHHQIKASYSENGITRTALSDEFVLDGTYTANATITGTESPFGINGSPIKLNGTYLLLDTTGFSNVVYPYDSENISNGYLYNGELGIAGKNAMMIFTKDQFINGTRVTLESFANLISSSGAAMEVDKNTPAFDWIDYNGSSKLMVFSINGECTLEDPSVVIVYGELKNTVDPATGISSNDFVLSNSSFFYVSLTDEETPEPQPFTLSVTGTLSENQRAFTAVNPAGLTVKATYADGTVRDVTAKVTAATNDGKQTWGNCLVYRKGDWQFDTSPKHISFSYTENGETETADSPDFGIEATYEPGEEYHELPNTAGAFITMNCSGHLNIVEPVDISFESGYLIDGAETGTEVWAVFSRQDYENNNAVTAQVLQQYIAASGADLAGSTETPQFGLYIVGQEGKVLCWSVDGSGSPGEYVIIFGQITKAIDPAEGITKSHFDESWNRTPHFVRLVSD